ncbi:MAG: hypothetical protein ABSH07_11745 [Candidatus Dormibacteria bacterium]|jgi:hypothetical protein
MGELRERYFPLREIMEACRFAADGGVAIHENLDYSGTVIGGKARRGPFLHVMAELPVLRDWGEREGMRASWIQEAHGWFPPHFDAFGSRATRILARLGHPERPESAAAAARDLFNDATSGPDDD